MSNSSPDSPQRDERIGNLSVTFSSLWAHLPGSVFLLQTRGWFLLGPLQWSSQSFPSASSWEFSLLLSYVGSHFLELPWPFLGNFLFCWSTSSSRFLRKGSWQVNVWEPCKCLYSTAALDSLSGYGTWLWKRFFLCISSFPPVSGDLPLTQRWCVPEQDLLASGLRAGDSAVIWVVHWGILPGQSLKVFSLVLVSFPGDESSDLLPVGYKPHCQHSGSQERGGECGVLQSKVQTVI